MSNTGPTETQGLIQALNIQTIKNISVIISTISRCRQKYYRKECYSKFIVLHWIPTFVVFVDTIKPRHSVHHEMHIQQETLSTSIKAKLKVNEHLIYRQSAKIDFSENKWHHSMYLLMFWQRSDEIDLLIYGFWLPLRYIHTLLDNINIVPRE
jgi:hypothetical protein